MDSINLNLEAKHKVSTDISEDNQSSQKLSDHEIKSDVSPKLWNKSRKISKKRNKYQKIDDEIRLKLVEAVEKNGEMLKTVINFSHKKPNIFPKLGCKEIQDQLFFCQVNFSYI